MIDFTTAAWQIKTLWLSLDAAGRLAADNAVSEINGSGRGGIAEWERWLAGQSWAQTELRRAAARIESGAWVADKAAKREVTRAAIAKEFPEFAGKPLSAKQRGHLTDQLRRRGYDI